MIIVYIICSDKNEAHAIGAALLEKKLIACYNCMPVESGFWWKEAVQSQEEYVLVGKTTTKLFQRIVGVVEKMHSYEVPAILSFRVHRVSDAYRRYIKKQVLKPRGSKSSKKKSDT